MSCGVRTPPADTRNIGWGKEEGATLKGNRVRERILSVNIVYML